MSLWHTVLYVAAAIIALRSFIQLVTNYRSEYEEQLVKEELRYRVEQLEKEKAEAHGEHDSDAAFDATTHGHAEASH